MIFNDLDFIDNLPLDAYAKHFGSLQKSKYTSRLFRSNMMLNPLRLKHLNRIDDLEADVITLNLEDAIAPSRKKEALYNIALFLSHLQESKSFIVIRTNPLGEGGEEEITFLNDFGFDAIRIAKIKTPTQIALALTLLSPDKELHISLETKEAFYGLRGLRIDERLTMANIGILDLLSSLGLPQSLVQQGNPTIDHILSKFLVDAKSVGIRPVSFMFQDYNDTETFRRWCEHEKMMGFESKACMGPAQVAIANDIFGLSPEAVKRAEHIKRVFEENAAKGINGFMDDKYGFIDEPIYRDALLILNVKC
ncbi:MAG: aldolase/citrate lyase family protein [Campylobacterota bacterium]|nr:aldolase/citrate lyase family protein [Campylobacterota bacterium]